MARRSRRSRNSRRSHKAYSTRRKPGLHPRGILDVRLGGYGFVQTAEGEYFIPESKMRDAFNGDLVEVSPLPNRDSRNRTSKSQYMSNQYVNNYTNNAISQERPAARVVRVLERSIDSLIGTYEVAEPFGVVVPEDPRIHHDIFTRRSDFPDIPDGALVRVRVTQFPGKGTAATGVIEEVIGSSDDTSLLIDMIVARHKFETKFSNASMEQAELTQLDVQEALANGYKDLRNRFIFTIDPIDAKDFDDAISFERITKQSPYENSAWRLGVHIADVSSYVPWGSSIDLDARRRGTSVYLADRVIPMLPEKLSNDLCSLRAHEDRLSVTLDIYLTDDFKKCGIEIYPAIICSNVRLDYDTAQKILESQSSSHEGVAWRLLALNQFAEKRIMNRKKRYGIDIDSVEAKVRLRDDGTPIDIVLRKKNEATSLIEEAMILANESVAEYLEDKNFPCMYRVHEAPDSMSLEGIVPLLSEFSWFNKIDVNRLISGDKKQLYKIIEEATDCAESQLVSNVVLRSMKKAIYQPVNKGHYALASQAYAHFTSPIRRYPDLIVHRMLKAEADSRLGRKTPKYSEQRDALGWLGEHSSEMERLAALAARESQECKIAEYLLDYIGQAFTGYISGVQNYGIYIRLENTAEGLIPVRELGNEYFILDPLKHRLTGSDSGKVFALGAQVKVILVASEPRTRTIKFKLA